ncbi:hypothetical protein PoB_004254200 [Plakobranchus ocellatus]|uniref:G-protein coupled receptors family 1 profile domain-containing protein n=1 Tax=Plakobranchus ocellatus TaxID=259542 RepID=A0AAV4BA67_9GAST|nr:hypothetical protein PoB_004254200 [Plakobranchus ocellatus]
MNFSSSSLENITGTDVLRSKSSLLLRNHLMGAFGTILNMAAVLFLWMSKRIRSPLRMTLINMALNDLFFNVSVAIWGPHFPCWPALYIVCASVLVSYFITCVLAVYNYVNVFLPLDSRRMLTFGRLLAAIASCWLGGHLIGSLCLGITIPAGASCYVLSVMPTPGILAESSICLACSCVVLVINIRIILRIREIPQRTTLPVQQLSHQVQPKEKNTSSSLFALTAPQKGTSSITASKALTSPPLRNFDLPNKKNKVPLTRLAKSNIHPTTAGKVGEGAKLKKVSNYSESFSLNFQVEEVLAGHLPNSSILTNAPRDNFSECKSYTLSKNVSTDSCPFSRYAFTRQGKRRATSVDTVQTREKSHAADLHLSGTNNLYPRDRKYVESYQKHKVQLQGKTRGAEDANISPVLTKPSTNLSAEVALNVNNFPTHADEENDDIPTAQPNHAWKANFNARVGKDNTNVEYLQKSDINKHINSLVAFLLPMTCRLNYVFDNSPGPKNYNLHLQMVRDNSPPKSSNNTQERKINLNEVVAFTNDGPGLTAQTHRHAFLPHTTNTHTDNSQHINVFTISQQVNFPSDTSLSDFSYPEEFFQLHQIKDSRRGLGKFIFRYNNAQPNDSKPTTLVFNQDRVEDETDTDIFPRSEKTNHIFHEVFERRKNYTVNKDSHELEVCELSDTQEGIVDTGVEETIGNLSAPISHCAPNVIPMVAINSETGVAAYRKRIDAGDSPITSSQSRSLTLQPQTEQQLLRQRPVSTSPVIKKMTTSENVQAAQTPGTSANSTGPADATTAFQKTRGRWRRCTQNTLLILSSWCCFLSLPYVIFGGYVAFWATQDRLSFINSWAGTFSSSLVVLNSILNPLLYAWRFIEWRAIWARIKHRILRN